MMRPVALALLLAGCSAPAVAPVPPTFPACPPSVRVPAMPPRIRTAERVGRFAVQLEVARERERARGNECAAAADAMREWIEGRKK